MERLRTQVLWFKPQHPHGSTLPQTHADKPSMYIRKKESRPVGAAYGRAEESTVLLSPGPVGGVTEPCRLGQAARLFPPGQCWEKRLGQKQRRRLEVGVKAMEGSWSRLENLPEVMRPRLSEKMEKGSAERQRVSPLSHDGRRTRL